MDILTHSVSGALIARAGLAKDTSLSVTVAMLAGSLTAMFPDLFDLAGNGVNALIDMHPHFDWLHSLVLFPLWVVILSLLFAQVWKQYHWREFLPVCGLSYGLHLFLDAMTVQGIPVLIPFNDIRLSFDIIYFFDLYIGITLLAALLISLLIKKFARQAALSGMVIILGYIVALHFLHRSALQHAYAFVPEGDLAYKVRALAQPNSPLRWKLIIEKEQRIFLRYIHLWQNPDGMDWRVAYKTGDAQQRELAQKILQHPDFKSVKQNMLLPVVYHSETSGGANCIWFVDEAIMLGNIQPSRVVGGCEIKASGEIRIYQLEEGIKVSIKK